MDKVKEIDSISKNESVSQGREGAEAISRNTASLMDKLKTGLKTSLSSNAATVISVTLLYPLEIVKTRSQIQGDVQDNKAPLK